MQTTMGRIVLVAVLALLALTMPVILVTGWVSAAGDRLAEADAAEAGAEPEVAIASEADEEYCTPALRTILRRVLTSCGLIGGSGRGCQPVEARSVATMDGDDFNALFIPMRERGGILQFEQASAELDPGDTAMIDRVFSIDDSSPEQHRSYSDVGAPLIGARRGPPPPGGGALDRVLVCLKVGRCRNDSYGERLCRTQ